jgi:hypothetical protein
MKNLVPLMLTAAVIFSAYLFLNKHSLQTKLSDEKVKSENLLAEKLKLDKSITLFQTELSELKGKNKQLDNMIADSNMKILKKNQEIDRLLVQNASIPELKKKLAELEQLKNQLAGSLNDANSIVAQLKGENQRLSQQLETAMNSNREISNDIAVLKVINSDNYRTEAVKGKKDKLTINARKTDKIMVSFDIPSSVGKDVYFNLVMPNGKELSSLKDFAAKVEFEENGDAFIASTNSFMGGEGTQRVKMSYDANDKLTKGVYVFQVYNHDKFLGSTQMRLK